MKIFKEETVAADVMDMTYTELVLKDLHVEQKRIEEKTEALNTSIIEADNERKNGGYGQDELAKFIEITQEQVRETVKELGLARVNNPIDFELQEIAGELDGADGYNRAIDLLYMVNNKMVECMGYVIEANTVCGGMWCAPDLAGRLASIIPRLVNMLSLDVPNLRKRDKAVLKKRFDDKFAEVQAEKNKAKTNAVKFKVV